MSTQDLYGIHVVETVIKHHPERIVELLLDSKRDFSRLETQASDYGVLVKKVTKKDLDARVNGNHQGVIAKTRPRVLLSEADFFKTLDIREDPLLLVLDGIEDPHNLGACLRVANAVNATVVLPKDRSASLTPAVYKVSCGAAETTPIVHIVNVARFLDRLKKEGVLVVGTEMSATTSLYELEYTLPVAMVLGSEEEGLRSLVSKSCDHLVSIPMPGAMESLNVSVASGICLYEVLRQRKKLFS